ncbi:flavin reductase family protein [Rhodococcus opacus]|uniref:flavin reductase family protein n=1 Tax=Rhodococcus opacus TaxID=37919 RepID=UPI002A5A645A|nr:flavin reductase family protein [Rhodococcus opacus]
MADHSELRSALGFFPSGIAALCATVDVKPVGLVATSFSVGVSYDPPLVLFSIQNSSRTWPCLRTAERLGVSILGEGQDHVCRQLASRTRYRFAGLETIRTEHNSLLLHGSALWLDCEIRHRYQRGITVSSCWK